MRTLSILIKPVSGLCNLNCSYCFYADEMKNRSCPDYGRMSRQTLERIYEKVAEVSPPECTIAFQGGEPTLAGPEFFEACIRLQEKHLGSRTKVHYAIQTNGYDLDRAWCAFFLKNEFLVGVSIDGIAAVHDAFRKDRSGNGTYERVMKGAALLKEYGVPFNVLSVVNARTAPRVRRIYESFQKNGFMFQQYIACLEPIRESGGRPEYSLTPESYGRFLTELFELWYQDLVQGRQPYIRQFESYIALLLGQPPQACEQRGSCSFQNVIEADGSLYPCDFYALDEWRCKNVNDADFCFGVVPEAGKRFMAEEAVPKTCLECRYYALCQNGCRRLRTLWPDGEMRNRYCSAYLYFFERCYDRLSAVAAAVMPGKTVKGTDSALNQSLRK